MTVCTSIHISHPSPHATTTAQILQLPRPVDVPDEGILCDLLW